MEVNKISNRIAYGILDLCKNLELKTPKIALFFPNCSEAITTWFAISKIGGISIPINFRLSDDDLEFVLKNSEADILFIDYSFYNEFKRIINNLKKIKKIIIKDAPGGFHYNEICINFEDIISNVSKKPNIEVKPSQILEIIYTAGTTGRPKGVIYKNHHTLSGISVGTKLEHIGFGQDHHTIYSPLPLFQAFSRYLVIIPAMYYNASVIIPKKFQSAKFWKDVETYKPNAFCYVGAYLMELINGEPMDSDRDHSVKYAFGFGAFKKIWEAFERRFGIQIIEAWSLVESIGMTINVIGSNGGKIGSVGVPTRGYDLKIVDTNGTKLPPGSNNIGEIISRTKLPIELEYYNIKGKSEISIGENRWVYTGDFGYIDNDGFLYFLGRKSDMIQRGREIFFASDIERVANSHQFVINSAVFEVPVNDSSETALKICVKIKNDISMTYEDLHSYLKQNLAYFMVPRFIEYKRILPKNANDLVQKFILKEEWQTKESKMNTYDTHLKKMIPNELAK
jgi:crotonobetaine/carnitine-CoA ligase